jgi:hypothetical protein
MSPKDRGEAAQHLTDGVQLISFLDNVSSNKTLPDDSFGLSAYLLIYEPHG